MKIQASGFTLIEVMLAAFLFVVFVIIGVGGFVRAVHTQREAGVLIAAQSNASVALEQMAREMRTGYLFCTDIAHNGSPNPSNSCSSACVVDAVTHFWTCDNFIDFYNADGADIQYKSDPVTGLLERSESGGAFVPMTANNTKISHLAFSIFGNSETDHWAPRITISMGVAANVTDPAIASDILNLQTTVVSRIIDCTQSGPPNC